MNNNDYYDYNSPESNTYCTKFLKCLIPSLIFTIGWLIGGEFPCVCPLNINNTINID